MAAIEFRFRKHVDCGTYDYFRLQQKMLREAEPGLQKLVWQEQIVIVNIGRLLLMIPLCGYGPGKGLA